MGYAAFSVVFGEQPSASKWNILGTNDASFNDGTGFAASVLQSQSVKWSDYSVNIKSAQNTSAPAITNSDQDLASSGLSLSFTSSGTSYAFVSMSLGIGSTTDFEFRPQIRLGGVTQKTFNPQAAPGTTSSRASVRSGAALITLANGVNTLSAGVFVSAGTSITWQINGGSIAAIVFGNITA